MKFPIQQRCKDKENRDKSAAAHDPPNHLLVSEREPDGARRANHASIWIHLSILANSFVERDRLNFTCAQANHSSEFSTRHQLHGFDAEKHVARKRSNGLGEPPR